MLMVEGRGTIRAGGALSDHVRDKQEEEGPVRWKIPGCGGRETEGCELHVRKNGQCTLGFREHGGPCELRGYETLLRGQKNRLENYDSERESTVGTRTIPRLPLVPAHMERTVIKGEMTVWEVAMLLKRMRKGATQELNNLINPVMLWALQACCKTRRGGGTNGAPNDSNDEGKSRSKTPDAD